MHKLTKSLIITALFCLVTACASTKDEPDLTEKEYYDNAQLAMENHNFETAIENLQRLEARYPFGPYAEQAQLEIIYAYYRNDEPEAAVAAAERFIRLHPQHPNVDYAYYIRGLANYTANESALDRFLPTDITQRHPGAAIESFDDFQQLVSRYPNSPYAPDAQARMLYLRARLARFEINVANYYLARGAYIAALNRGAYVIENYPQTPAIADALAVIIQSYLALDMPEPANHTLAVLRANFPDYPSLDAHGQFKNQLNATPSVLSTLTFGLIDQPKPPRFDHRAPYLTP